MRSIPLTLVALSLALPAVAQDADRTVAGGGRLAPGWMARTGPRPEFRQHPARREGDGVGHHRRPGHDPLPRKRQGDR